MALTDSGDTPSGLTDDEIRALCQSGRVCETIGHKWFVRSKHEMISAGMGHRELRTCQLCHFQQELVTSEPTWQDVETGASDANT